MPFSQTRGDSPKDPAVLAADPKGQVPVLVDDGLALYDSTAILEYLEDAYPSPAPCPERPEERARCRLIDVSADEVMLAPLRALMRRTEPRPKDEARWIENEARAKGAEPVIADHFGKLEDELAGKPFPCGAFSAADISAHGGTRCPTPGRSVLEAVSRPRRLVRQIDRTARLRPGCGRDRRRGPGALRARGRRLPGLSQTAAILIEAQRA
ncbi:glutathione S-transferase family protein [Microvirga makkahensis]|uniref:glutathione S-transferase family protein n=1 Tax=Microvirga makkahensis TaxID=1128670 RepID=UPI0031B5863A